MRTIFLGGPGMEPVEALVAPGSRAAATAHGRVQAWQATCALFEGTLHARRRGRRT